MGLTTAWLFAPSVGTLRVDQDDGLHIVGCQGFRSKFVMQRHKTASPICGGLRIVDEAGVSNELGLGLVRTERPAATLGDGKASRHGEIRVSQGGRSGGNCHVCSIRDS